MKYFLEEIESFIVFIFSNMPGRTGVYLRKFLYKFLLNKVGEDFYTEKGLVFTGYKNIYLYLSCL